MPKISTPFYSFSYTVKLRAAAKIWLKDVAFNQGRPRFTVNDKYFNRKITWEIKRIHQTINDTTEKDKELILQRGDPNPSAEFQWAS